MNARYWTHITMKHIQANQSEITTPHVAIGYQDSFQFKQALRKERQKGYAQALKYINQLYEGHGWQMVFHYHVSKKIHDRYGLTRNELIVLLAAYLYKRAMGAISFTPADLNKVLIGWGYSTIYHYSISLLKQKKFEIVPMEFQKRQHYNTTYICDEIYKAYSQFFRETKDQFEEEHGSIDFNTGLQ